MFLRYCPKVFQSLRFWDSYRLSVGVDGWAAAWWWMWLSGHITGGRGGGSVANFVIVSMEVENENRSIK